MPWRTSVRSMVPKSQLGRVIPSHAKRKLGRSGVEQIIEITLTAEEDAALKKSAAAVKELFDKLKTGAAATV